MMILAWINCYFDLLCCLCLGNLESDTCMSAEDVYQHTSTFSVLHGLWLDWPNDSSQDVELGMLRVGFLYRGGRVSWGMCWVAFDLPPFDCLKISVLPLQLVGSVTSRFLFWLRHLIVVPQIRSFNLFESQFSHPLNKWKICLVEGRRVIVLILTHACSWHVKHAQLLFKIVTRIYCTFVLEENTMYLFSFMFNFFFKNE